MRSPFTKSQGSEYPAVVIPLSTQHYPILRRNLYTGIMRGKRLVVLVGQRKALAIADRDSRAESRWSKRHQGLRTEAELIISSEVSNGVLP
jgi:exodeoxyribonuclease V alpha subunit